MGLLDLVEEEEAERVALHRLRELPPLFVANVAGRGSEETLVGVRVAVLAHVEPLHGALVPEDKLGHRLGKLRLSDARETGEEEDAARLALPGVLRAREPERRTPEDVGRGPDGLGLPEDARAEELLSPGELRPELGPVPVAFSYPEAERVDELLRLAGRGAPIDVPLDLAQLPERHAVRPGDEVLERAGEFRGTGQRREEASPVVRRRRRNLEGGRERVVEEKPRRKPRDVLGDEDEQAAGADVARRSGAEKAQERETLGLGRRCRERCKLCGVLDDDEGRNLRAEAPADLDDGRLDRGSRRLDRAGEEAARGRRALPEDFAQLPLHLGAPFFPGPGRRRQGHAVDHVVGRDDLEAIGEKVEERLAERRRPRLAVGPGAVDEVPDVPVQDEDPLELRQAPRLARPLGPALVAHASPLRRGAAAIAAARGAARRAGSTWRSVRPGRLWVLDRVFTPRRPRPSTTVSWRRQA